MTSVSSISLSCLYKNYPVVLNFTWNDYNGLVWGQEAYPVANKSEYIREGYALRKSLKGLKSKKQKKKIKCFAKFIKRTEGAWKMYNSNCFCKIDFLSTIKRSYCPLSPNSQRFSTCCCYSQPVTCMLATGLGWLTDFLTGAIMESRKAARSKAVATPRCGWRLPFLVKVILNFSWSADKLHADHFLSF